MTDKHPMPEPEKVKQTVANLRKTRLEMELFGLEMEEINARLEHEIRQQRLKRVQHSLSLLADKSHELEQNQIEVLS